jgi:hypothetical protein
MRLKHRMHLLCLLAGVPLLAAAGVQDRVTTVRAGFTAQSFHYRENDTDGSFLDREQGWMPGIHADVERDFGTWLAGAGLDWSAGAVDYASPGADSTSDADIRQLETRVGLPLLRHAGDRLHVITGLGVREWRRDIRSIPGVFGLDETYRWGYALLGVRGEHLLVPGLRLTLDAQLTRTLRPTIKVEFYNGWDSARLDLGARTGYRIRLSLERRIDERCSFWLAPWYEYWELGRSADADVTAAGAVVNRVAEPRSETGIFGLSAGIRWHFR